MTRQDIVFDNGATASGLIEPGYQAVPSYPGIPGSGILPEAIRSVRSEGLDIYLKWSANK